ncbi:DUF6292 family protein [Nocardia sp. NPDC004582]
MSDTVHHAYISAVAEGLRIFGWPVVESRVSTTTPLHGWICIDEHAKGLERSDYARLLAWDEEDGWHFGDEDLDEPGVIYGPIHYLGEEAVPTVASVLELAETQGRRFHPEYEAPGYRSHTDRDDLPSQLARAVAAPC